MTDLLTQNGYQWPSKYPSPLDHQRVTAEFLIRNCRAFCFNDIGCVDGETEYLTPTGWARIDSYVGGEVAQWNIKTRQAEFVTPTDYIKMPCDEFYHIKTKYGLDQMLSKEHRVLYVGSTDKLAVRTAEDVASRHWGSKYGFKGRILTTFNAPERTGLDMSDADLRLTVAVIADSYFPANNSTNSCVFRLKRKRKIRRLKQLLSAAKILCTDRPCKPTGFHRMVFDAPLKVKIFDSYFWDASPDQLEIIADEVGYWDGSFRKSWAVDFNTVEKESADFIQYCFAATGRTASLARVVREDRNDGYTVHARSGGDPLYITGLSKSGCRYDNIRKVSTPGAWKYCFSVPETYLILRRRGRIFVTGNTGKTLSLLWGADFLMTHGLVKKVLVVAPLSTLWAVWEDEIFINLFHRRAAVLHGTKEKRLKMLQQDVDFYIINYAGIGVIRKELEDRKDIDLVIVDEGAELRNGRTDLWRNLNWLAGPNSGKGMWWVTGSPMPKGPEDIWAQARIINPELVPRYFTRFRDMMMIKLTMYEWGPIKGWENKCFAMLQPSIRFKRDECIDLPPSTTQPRVVPMSAEQDKAYKAMLRDLYVQMKEGEITAVNEAAKRIKLMQLSAGAVYDGEDYVHHVDCAPKFKALQESIRESGNKAIVFVAFKHSIGLLEGLITKLGLTVGVVYGDVNPKKRKEVFDNFQRGSLNIILAQPATMAHGLTLTASHTIIWWGPVDSYRIYEQANGRISRPGQTSKQTIIHLICSETEKKIYARLKNKEKMQGLLLEILEEK